MAIEGSHLTGAASIATPMAFEPVCLAHRVAPGSDACAAWLAAHAAQDAVFWSGVQAGIALLGLLGLLATLYFALHANRTARRSNEDQLRAWVKVTPEVAAKLIRSNDGCSLAINVEIENIGSTPATDVELHARLYSKGDIAQEVQRFADGVLASRGAEYPCTLFTGERVDRKLRLEDGAYGVEVPTDSMMLSLIVGARYRTIFDRHPSRARLTVRAYDLSNGDGGLVHANQAAGPGSLVLTTNILVPGTVS